MIRNVRRAVRISAAVLLCFFLCMQSLTVFADVMHSSCSADSDLSIETQGKRLIVSVPQRTDYQYVKIGLRSESTGTVITGSMQRVLSGSVSMSTSAISDGVYFLQLWKSGNGSASTEILTDHLGFIIVISDGAASIRKSAAYDAYCEYYSKKNTSVEALYYYLKVSDLIQSDDSRIVSRAEQIIRGIEGAYDRARAVHDWVAVNIYYDVDAAQSENVVIGNDLFIDAVGTLNKQTSVCQGYADLTVALLRASGIPARTVIGYALTGADEEWNDENIFTDTKQNHAWVEAYLDERWVLMDPTWDSRSIFYKGSGIKADCVDTYFDSTLDFFSYGHLQTVADDFSESYMKMIFADIRDHWGYANIRFAVNNDIMHGMGDAYFRPNGTTTQAMFITMLANCAGESIGNAEEGPWYADYAAWAEKEGITEGVGGYDPAALISREQMAVMLRNFIIHEEAAVEVHDTEDFRDLGEASDWSRQAVQELGSWKIVLGKGEGYFDPQGCFTRAEAATIVARACDTLLRTYLNS